MILFLLIYFIDKIVFFNNLIIFFLIKRAQLTLHKKNYYDFFRNNNNTEFIYNLSIINISIKKLHSLIFYTIILLLIFISLYSLNSITVAYFLRSKIIQKILNWSLRKRHVNNSRYRSIKCRQI